MRIAKEKMDVKVEAPGAVARQQGGFGDASNLKTMAGEHFAMRAGTDIAPLLEGLTDDLCQAPHWGYMISGRVTATFKGGKSEEARTGDLFFWPPGHTVKVEEDAEFVLFSPHEQHAEVLDHINSKLQQAG